MWGSSRKTMGGATALLLAFLAGARATPLPPAPEEPFLPISPPPITGEVAPSPTLPGPDLLLPPPFVVDQALAVLPDHLLVTGVPIDPEAWQPPATGDEGGAGHPALNLATLFEWLMGAVMAGGLLAIFLLPRWFRRHGHRSHRHHHDRHHAPTHRHGDAPHTSGRHRHHHRSVVTPRT